MPAGSLDIIVEKGSTFAKTLIWKDAAGVAINLTGFTARMHIREFVEAEDPAAVELTTENGRITITSAEGKIELLIDAVTTAAITLAAGVYDLEMVSPTGVVTRLVEGKVTIKPEVTR